jgi:hypothetical protein
MDNMLRVISVVQQIMTELGGAVSEEAQMVAIKNCPEANEVKWQLEFIGPSKS